MYRKLMDFLEQLQGSVPERGFHLAMQSNESVEWTFEDAENAAPTTQTEAEGGQDPNLVHWYGPDDPENP